MRLIITWGVIALIGVATLAWGWSVDRQSVPKRLGDQTPVVTVSWYADLSSDAQAATSAYLHRVPDDTRERGERYSDSRMVAFWLRVVSVILATGFFCATRVISLARDEAERRFSNSGLVHALVAMQYFIALYVLSLPAEVYATFLRPHRFGFSDASFGAWLADSVVSWGVFTAFYLLGVVAIYQFIRRRPTKWVAWAIGIYLILRMAYTLLAPYVIDPLTNSYRPLQDGPQKQLILALAHENGIEDVAIVTKDASRQTRLLNAHVSGIGSTARISLDDNTLKETSDPMLAAVVGHEIGHYVMNHEMQGVVTDTIIMAFGFIFIAFGTRAIVGRMGIALKIVSVGDIASLPIFWGLFVLWGFLSLPASNAISREYEHQADLYGLNVSLAPHGLAEFMIHDADAYRLHPRALEYSLFYSHPSAAERIETAMQWRQAHATLVVRP